MTSDFRALVPKYQLTGHVQNVKAVAFNPTHLHLLSADSSTLRLWSLRKELKRIYQPTAGDNATSATGNILRIFYYAPVDVYVVVYGDAPAVSPLGGMVRVLHSSMADVLCFPAASSTILASAFHAKSNLLVTFAENKELKLWNFSRENDMLEVACAVTHQYTGSLLKSLYIPADGSCLVGCVSDDVMIWKLPTLELRSHISQITGDGSHVTAFALTNSGLLVIGSDSGMVLLWSVTKDGGADKITQFQAHADFITDLILANDGYSFFTCGQDATVAQWALHGNQELGRVAIHAKGFAKGRHMPAAHPVRLLHIAIAVQSVNKQLLVAVAGAVLNMIEIRTHQLPFGHVPDSVVMLAAAATGLTSTGAPSVLALLRDSSIQLIDSSSAQPQIHITSTQHRDAGALRRGDEAARSRVHQESSRYSVTSTPSVAAPFFKLVDTEESFGFGSSQYRDPSNSLIGPSAISLNASTAHVPSSPSTDRSLIGSRVKRPLTSSNHPLPPLPDPTTSDAYISVTYFCDMLKAVILAWSDGTLELFDVTPDGVGPVARQTIPAAAANDSRMATVPTCIVTVPATVGSGPNPAPAVKVPFTKSASTAVLREEPSTASAATTQSLAHASSAPWLDTPFNITRSALAQELASPWSAAVGAKPTASLIAGRHARAAVTALGTGGTQPVHILVGTSDGQLHVWAGAPKGSKAAKGRLLYECTVETSGASLVSLQRSSNTLVTATASNGVVRGYKVGSWQMTSFLITHPDDHLSAVSSTLVTAALAIPATKPPVSAGPKIAQYCTSPPLIIGFDNGLIEAWKLLATTAQPSEKPTPIASVRCHTRAITVLSAVQNPAAGSSDAVRFLSASLDHTAVLWAGPTMSPLRTFSFRAPVTAAVLLNAALPDVLIGLGTDIVRVQGTPADPPSDVADAHTEAPGSPTPSRQPTATSPIQAVTSPSAAPKSPASPATSPGPPATSPPFKPPPSSRRNGGTSPTAASPPNTAHTARSIVKPPPNLVAALPGWGQRDQIGSVPAPLQLPPGAPLGQHAHQLQSERNPLRVDLAPGSTAGITIHRPATAPRDPGTTVQLEGAQIWTATSPSRAAAAALMAGALQPWAQDTARHGGASAADFYGMQDVEDDMPAVPTMPLTEAEVEELRKAFSSLCSKKTGNISSKRLPRCLSVIQRLADQVTVRGQVDRARISVGFGHKNALVWWEVLEIAEVLGAMPIERVKRPARVPPKLPTMSTSPQFDYAQSQRAVELDLGSTRDFGATPQTPNDAFIGGGTGSARVRERRVVVTYNDMGERVLKPMDLVLTRKGDKPQLETPFVQERRKERQMKPSYSQTVLNPPAPNIATAMAYAQIGKGIPVGIKVAPTVQEALAETRRQIAEADPTAQAPSIPLTAPLLPVSATVHLIREILQAKHTADVEADLSGAHREPFRNFVAQWMVRQVGQSAYKSRLLSLFASVVAFRALPVCRSFGRFFGLFPGEVLQDQAITLYIAALAWVWNRDGVEGAKQVPLLHAPRHVPTLAAAVLAQAEAEDHGPPTKLALHISRQASRGAPRSPSPDPTSQLTTDGRPKSPPRDLIVSEHQHAVQLAGGRVSPMRLVGKDLVVPGHPAEDPAHIIDEFLDPAAAAARTHRAPPQVLTLDHPSSPGAAPNSAWASTTSLSVGGPTATSMEDTAATAVPMDPLGPRAVSPLVSVMRITQCVQELLKHRVSPLTVRDIQTALRHLPIILAEGVGPSLEYLELEACLDLLLDEWAEQCDQAAAIEEDLLGPRKVRRASVEADEPSAGALLFSGPTTQKRTRLQPGRSIQELMRDMVAVVDHAAPPAGLDANSVEQSPAVSANVLTADKLRALLCLFLDCDTTRCGIVTPQQFAAVIKAWGVWSHVTELDLSEGIKWFRASPRAADPSGPLVSWVFATDDPANAAYSDSTQGIDYPQLWALLFEYLDRTAGHDIPTLGALAAAAAAGAVNVAVSKRRRGKLATHIRHAVLPYRPGDLYGYTPSDRLSAIPDPDMALMSLPANERRRILLTRQSQYINLLNTVPAPLPDAEAKHALTAPPTAAAATAAADKAVSAPVTVEAALAPALVKITPAPVRLTRSAVDDQQRGWMMDGGQYDQPRRKAHHRDLIAAAEAKEAMWQPKPRQQRNLNVRAARALQDLMWPLRTRGTELTPFSHGGTFDYADDDATETVATPASLEEPSIIADQDTVTSGPTARTEQTERTERLGGTARTAGTERTERTQRTAISTDRTAEASGLYIRFPFVEPHRYPVSRGPTSPISPTRSPSPRPTLSVQTDSKVLSPPSQSSPDPSVIRAYHERARLHTPVPVHQPMPKSAVSWRDGLGSPIMPATTPGVEPAPWGDTSAGISNSAGPSTPAVPNSALASPTFSTHTDFAASTAPSGSATPTATAVNSRRPVHAAPTAGASTHAATSASATHSGPAGTAAAVSASATHAHPDPTSTEPTTSIDQRRRSSTKAPSQAPSRKSSVASTGGPARRTGSAAAKTPGRAAGAQRRSSNVSAVAGHEHQADGHAHTGTGEEGEDVPEQQDQAESEAAKPAVDRAMDTEPADQSAEEQPDTDEGDDGDQTAEEGETDEDGADDTAEEQDEDDEGDANADTADEQEQSSQRHADDAAESSRTDENQEAVGVAPTISIPRSRPGTSESRRSAPRTGHRTPANAQGKTGRKSSTASAVSDAQDSTVGDAHHVSPGVAERRTQRLATSKVDLGRRRSSVSKDAATAAQAAGLQSQRRASNASRRSSIGDRRRSSIQSHASVHEPTNFEEEDLDEDLVEPPKMLQPLAVLKETSIPGMSAERIASGRSTSHSHRSSRPGSSRSGTGMPTHDAHSGHEQPQADDELAQPERSLTDNEGAESAGAAGTDDEPDQGEVHDESHADAEAADSVPADAATDAEPTDAQEDQAAAPGEAGADGETATDAHADDSTGHASVPATPSGRKPGTPGAKPGAKPAAKVGPAPKAGVKAAKAGAKADAKADGKPEPKGIKAAKSPAAAKATKAPETPSAKAGAKKSPAKSGGKSVPGTAPSAGTVGEAGTEGDGVPPDPMPDSDAPVESVDADAEPATDPGTADTSASATPVVPALSGTVPPAGSSGAHPSGRTTGRETGRVVTGRSSSSEVSGTWVNPGGPSGDGDGDGDANADADGTTSDAERNPDATAASTPTATAAAATSTPAPAAPEPEPQPEDDVDGELEEDDDDHDLRASRKAVSNEQLDEATKRARETGIIELSLKSAGFGTDISIQPMKLRAVDGWWERRTDGNESEPESEEDEEDAPKVADLRSLYVMETTEHLAWPPMYLNFGVPWDEYFERQKGDLFFEAAVHEEGMEAEEYRLAQQKADMRAAELQAREEHSQALHDPADSLSDLRAQRSALRQAVASGAVDVTELPLNSSVDCALPSGGWVYFQFTVSPEHRESILTVHVEPHTGAPDLFVSTVTLPSLADYGWRPSATGTSRLVILPTDPGHKLGTYYVGVFAHTSASFSLYVHSFAGEETRVHGYSDVLDTLTHKFQTLSGSPGAAREAYAAPMPKQAAPVVDADPRQAADPELQPGTDDERDANASGDDDSEQGDDDEDMQDEEGDQLFPLEPMEPGFASQSLPTDTGLLVSSMQTAAIAGGAPWLPEGQAIAAPVSDYRAALTEYRKQLLRNASKPPVPLPYSLRPVSHGPGRTKQSSTPASAERPVESAAPGGLARSSSAPQVKMNAGLNLQRSTVELLSKLQGAADGNELAKSMPTLKPMPKKAKGKKKRKAKKDKPSPFVSALIASAKGADLPLPRTRLPSLSST